MIPFVIIRSSYYYYYWSLLYSAILRSRADSLRSHVILREWMAFYSVFFEYPPKWCTYSYSCCSCASVLLWILVAFRSQMLHTGIAFYLPLFSIQSNDLFQFYTTVLDPEGLICQVYCCHGYKKYNRRKVWVCPGHSLLTFKRPEFMHDFCETKIALFS